VINIKCTMYVTDIFIIKTLVMYTHKFNNLKCFKEKYKSYLDVHMNEWMNEWINEQTNERTNEWCNIRICLNKLLSVCRKYMSCLMLKITYYTFIFLPMHVPLLLLFFYLEIRYIWLLYCMFLMCNLLKIKILLLLLFNYKR
jgi:hypothetical protein